MRTLIIGFVCLLASTALGQDFKGIRGTVQDSVNAPLPYATIAALSPIDSTMIGFAVSNNDGDFKIELPDTGKYIVKVVLVGYTPYNQDIRLTHLQPVLDLGDIPLSNGLLKGFNLTAEHIPMLIKEDTIEYNADAFKVDANAVVEDLLKELPGVEVAQDGTVTAEGEEITKVYVDGKEFFGDDPKVATKNLPADAVKSVQVYDKKSETTDFTGVDDGTRSKAINIKLKKDKKKGGLRQAFSWLWNRWKI